MTVHHAQLRSGTKRVKEGNHSLARDTVLVDLMAFFYDCRDTITTKAHTQQTTAFNSSTTDED